jgi:hypothetical protein
MKANMGKSDRLIRIALAAVMATLFLTGVIDGTLGIVLVIFAAVFLLTSFIRFCPLYTFFGWNTCSIKSK